MPISLAELSAALECAKNVCECHRHPSGYMLRHCPAHFDEHPSLSLREDAGTILWNCKAGCSQQAVLDSLKGLGLLGVPGQKVHKGGGRHTPPKGVATVQPQAGCTLAQYSEAKRLPIDFLRGLGLQDISYLGNPATRIPYYRPDGTEEVRFRIALTGKDRFRWRNKSKPCLYGLW
jgi:hypothetical protein